MSWKKLNDASVGEVREAAIRCRVDRVSQYSGVALSVSGSWHGDCSRKRRDHQCEPPRHCFHRILRNNLTSQAVEYAMARIMTRSDTDTTSHALQLGTFMYMSKPGGGG